jgi:acetyl esterase/lipase
MSLEYLLMKRLSVLLLLVGLMFSMTACKKDGDSQIRLFSNKDGVAGAPPLENVSAIKATFTIDRDFTAQETEELDMIPYSKTMAFKEHGGYDHITTNDSVRHVVNHPAFKGFSQLILPRENNTYHYYTPLSNVRSLIPYHGHVDPDIVVGALNHMIDEVKDGKTIFYDLYTEQQKREDPSKELTGLFFFRGAPGAPFAIVCPGGGFSYVGSLHEGFPLALEISRKRYNAFVIRYRIDSEQRATEDLAAAIAYIFRHTEALGVSTEDYSLWGGSAGARMVGNIALSGVAAYGGGDLPKPSIVVIAYTGQSSFSKDFPPTFITVSANDSIANAAVVDKRVENLRKAGVEVEYRRYRTAGHGFGLGTGTDAEGWLGHAVRFWEKHLTKGEKRQ